VISHNHNCGKITHPPTYLEIRENFTLSKNYFCFAEFLRVFSRQILFFKYISPFINFSYYYKIVTTFKLFQVFVVLEVYLLTFFLPDTFYLSLFSFPFFLVFDNTFYNILFHILFFLQ